MARIQRVEDDAVTAHLRFSAEAQNLPSSQTSQALTHAPESVNPAESSYTADFELQIQRRDQPTAAPSPSSAEWRPDPPQNKNSKRETDQMRRFDTTQLQQAGYGYSVHRDYAAHFFRWGWAARNIEEQATVLDVGCGQDQPLARVFANKAPGAQPFVMVAVDYNKIAKPFNAGWLVTRDQFDFTTRWQETLDALRQKMMERGRLPHYQGFDYITNFEVIEHMHTCDGERLLASIKQCLAPTGRFFLSTPVFNGKAAANHIHEYTVPELQAALERAGFHVVYRYGTFASYNEIKRAALPEHAAILEELKDWYDGDVAACFLAPLYPDASRNNIWVCRHPD